MAANPDIATPPARDVTLEIPAVLAAYAAAFSAGELEQFLTHFVAEPRENRNSGQAWFRQNYGRLFAETTSRRLAVEIIMVETLAGGWQVTARFDLQIRFADRRRPLRAERLVLYTLVEGADEILRIESIDYALE